MIINTNYKTEYLVSQNNKKFETRWILKTEGINIIYLEKNLYWA